MLLLRKKYNFKEEDIRDTLKQVIPFIPVGPAPDGALSHCLLWEKADIT